MLIRKVVEPLVHAFTTSHLVYCNSLYINLPQSHIAPLQRIQNSAARLVSRTKKSDHITPVLRSLHWLPVSHRIQFKVLTLAYKVKHGLAPKYISELLIPKKQPTTRVLRSSSTAHLEFNSGPIPRTRYGIDPSQSPLPLFGTISPFISVPHLHWTHLKLL